jgi:hypothetical protein
MADYHAIVGVVGARPRFFNMETEPDLDLIKQVKQVTILALERPARRFAGIRTIEVMGRCCPAKFGETDP